jgi:hypothetical protein
MNYYLRPPRSPNQGWADLQLFWRLLPALCGEPEIHFSLHRLCFPGLPQGAEAFHVLANRNGPLLDVCHGSRTFLHGKTLPVGACDAFGRRFG